MGQCRSATVLVIAVLFLAQWAIPDVASGAPTELPPDPRLDTVRPALEAAVAKATSAGIPPQTIFDKVREGLAKGVPAAAIRDAATHQVAVLVDAQQFVAAHRPGDPPFVLVRAIALAKERGIVATDLQPLVEALDPATVATRAVEAAADLTARGYPLKPAVAAVLTLAQREPAAVPRLLAGLEAIRSEKKSPPAATLASLQSHLSENDSFETLVTRILQEPPLSPTSRKIKHHKHP